MSRAFGDFDTTGFWERSEYADRTYVGGPLTDEALAAVEAELGYKLPASYVELMRHQNGGIPKKKNHRIKDGPVWLGGHVSIHAIYSIGADKLSSLCGGHGNRHWIGAWEYPAIGVYFADCPSAGHDMVCLDYSECGPRGEPRVVHVDQEADYQVTFIAPNFESFIRGLEEDEAFE